MRLKIIKDIKVINNINLIVNAFHSKFMINVFLSKGLRVVILTASV